MGVYSYDKKEKLKSSKLLETLFTKGRSLNAFPVKVFYMPLTTTDELPIKAGVGVSARNFKKAVDRNRIKRLLRECYRLNKLSLHEQLRAQQKKLAVFFLYVGKEMPDYSLLEEKMKLVITKLEHTLVG